MRSPAVQLFTERARSVRNDFVVDDTNAEAVAAVCRMLDGLPLAIELAAARTKVLSAAAIHERLDDRFSLLTAGSSADRRQRSLRAAIEWSHDLLDDDQRTYFARLGAFAGRFTYEAAGAVSGARSRYRSAGPPDRHGRPVVGRHRRRRLVPDARFVAGVRSRATRR